VVGQLVATDRLHPDRQRLLSAIGLPRIVHRQQYFLQNVFQLARLRQAATQKTAQMAAELVEECPVGPRIAIEPAQQQRAQLALAGLECLLRGSSLHRLLWLQVEPRNVRRPSARVTVGTSRGNLKIIFRWL